MNIRVLAFARIRELLGTGERSMTLPSGSRVADVWSALVAEHPEIAQLARSTRLARNGGAVRGEDAIAEGDEIALLPSVGGG